MEQTLVNRENAASGNNLTPEKPYVISINRLPSRINSVVGVSDQYFISILIVGFSLMGIFTIASYLLNYDFIYTLTLGLGILLFFIGALFLFLIPKKIVRIESTILRNIAYPMTRAAIEPIVIYVDKPVEVEKIVEKVVEKPVVRYIERPTVEYVSQPRRTLNIIKYKYIGSKQTKRFHKKSCRLSKLIKKKNKINSNSIVIFKNKKFKACKVCLKIKSKNAQTTS